MLSCARFSMRLSPTVPTCHSEYASCARSARCRDLVSSVGMNRCDTLSCDAAPPAPRMSDTCTDRHARHTDELDPDFCASVAHAPSHTHTHVIHSSTAFCNSEVSLKNMFLMYKRSRVWCPKPCGRILMPYQDPAVIPCGSPSQGLGLTRWMLVV